MKRLFLAILLLLSAPARRGRSCFRLSCQWCNTRNRMGAGDRQARRNQRHVAKRAYKADATILKGHKYRWQVTTGSVTGGVLQVVVGRVAHASGGGNVFAPVTGQGATPIASNFDVNSTLTTASAQPNSLDPVSAFRFVTGAVKYAQDDPLLYNGYPGASHLHEFVCNTGINAYSTFRSLRTSGDSSCGKVNRSSYWAPAMINGKGNVVVPYYWNVYYKGWPSGGGSCSLTGPDSTHVGICVEMPNGLRFVFGMDMAHASTTGAMSSNTREAGESSYWQCRSESDEASGTGFATGVYTSLDAMVAAGCPANSIVYQLLQAPFCWDGTHLDTPDHRSHVVWVNNGDTATVAWNINGVAQTPNVADRCPADHPYVIPNYSIQRFWKTRGDPTFVNDGVTSKWHLSSDEQMNPAMAHGISSHADVWFAWDQNILDEWHTNCTEAHKSCSAGALGTARAIVTRGASNLNSHTALTVPRNRLGWSGPLSGSGTFSGEFTAIDSGQLGLIGFENWTGEVTAFSLIDVTNSNNHAPITVTGSH
jgi:hypothetical protein